MYWYNILNSKVIDNTYVKIIWDAVTLMWINVFYRKSPRRSLEMTALNRDQCRHQTEYLWSLSSAAHLVQSLTRWLPGDARTTERQYGNIYADQKLHRHSLVRIFVLFLLCNTYTKQVFLNVAKSNSRVLQITLSLYGYDKRTQF